MNTTNTRPTSEIVRPTLVVYAKKGTAFLYIPRARPQERGRPQEEGEPPKVRLAPRLARLLIVLDVARDDDAHVIDDLRGYRTQSVLRAEIEKRQTGAITEDFTITEYVCLIRQAIAHEVALLPSDQHFHFDPIQNEARVGYRSTPPGLDVFVLQQ